MYWRFYLAEESRGAVVPVVVTRVIMPVDSGGETRSHLVILHPSFFQSTRNLARSGVTLGVTTTYYQPVFYFGNCHGFVHTSTSCAACQWHRRREKKKLKRNAHRKEGDTDTPLLFQFAAWYSADADLLYIFFLKSPSGY